MNNESDNTVTCAACGKVERLAVVEETGMSIAPSGWAGVSVSEVGNRPVADGAPERYYRQVVYHVCPDCKALTVPVFHGPGSFNTVR
ncbi:MAG: hypothetical protein WC551_10195 [Patescibacteria group bacterium]